MKVPAIEMSNSPEIISSPTPIAAMAVIGICWERIAKLPSVAKRMSSGLSRLQTITTTIRTTKTMTMLIAW